MKKNLIYFSILVGITTTGCTQDLKSGNTNWGVRIAQSYIYNVGPATLGIYFDSNKPQGLIGGPSKRTLEDIRYYDIPNYDGIGTVLGSFIYESVSSPISLNPYIPNALMTHWYNYADLRQYYMYFVIPEKARRLMAMPQTRIQSGIKKTCYQNEITFSFLPNGDGKAWVSGCGKYTYIGTTKPNLPPKNIRKIIKNSFPDYFDNINKKYAKYYYNDDFGIGKDLIANTKKRALDANKELSSISMEEIKKIYTATTCEGIGKSLITEPLEKLDLNTVTQTIVDDNAFYDSRRRCKKISKIDIDKLNNQN